MNKRIIAELIWRKSAFGDSSGTLLILYTQILNLKLQPDKFYITLQYEYPSFPQIGYEQSIVMLSIKYVNLDILN
jgi:hypothetical protein